MNIHSNFDMLAHGWADLGDDVQVPEQVIVTATPDEDDDPPYEVVATVRARGDRLECEEVTLRRHGHGPPITSESLRRIPLAMILRVGLRGLVSQRGRPFRPPDDIAAQGPTDEALRAAATVYRFAYALGDAPTKAVATSLGLTHSTAARWVATSRERGFLGRTTQGRAGGTEPEED